MRHALIVVLARSAVLAAQPGSAVAREAALKATRFHLTRHLRAAHTAGAARPDNGTMIRTLGFLAGALTTLAFIPQVLKAWRTGSTADLSLTMLSVFTAGLSLWIVYGVATRQAPVVVTNVVTLVLALALLALKLGLVRRSR